MTEAVRDSDAELAGAERRVEARSASFRKELGIGDLVLTQVLFVVGTVWVGAAAKLGDAQVVFWLLAIALFYLPQAAVVIHLSRRFPLEGGLYQWAKLGFGEGAAFMVAWNLWLFAIVLLGSIGLLVSTNIAYAVGAGGAWMASSKWLITVVSCAIIILLVAISTVGLGVGKWVHNAGSVMLMGAFAVLIAMPFIAHARGGLRAYHPFALALPALTLFNLNILGKMGMGALSGFEYVAIVAGEAKDAGRTIGRSVIIAAPIIALMFILGTGSVLAIVGADNVDLIGPIPQVYRVGLGSAGIVAIIVPIVILLLTARSIANSSVIFTGTTRVPMVAGWDRLMPAWFTRLHPRFRTPVNSIFFVGAASLLFTLAGIAGVGEQEAFQLLDNAAGIFYALTYLVMFALPLVGFRGAAERPSLALRVAASSGLAMTVLYVCLSVFPIVDVKSQAEFTTKIGAVVIGTNLIGAALFVAARRRRASAGLEAEQAVSR